MESALCVLTAEPRASRVSGVASLESWCVKGRDATVVGYEWAGLSMPARFPLPRQQQPIYGFAPQFARDNLKNQIILPSSARRTKKNDFRPKTQPAHENGATHGSLCAPAEHGKRPLGSTPHGAH